MEPKFSGHETFPLRYGWLFKSCNHMIGKEKFSVSNNVDIEDAVVALGVGKNMVSSMKYWSESCGVIEVDRKTFSQKVTELGMYLFGFVSSEVSEQQCNKALVGRDRYLEKKGSIWLLHFLLNFNEKELTAYRYFFNLTSLQQFDKDKLIHDIDSDVLRICGKEVKITSIKKDVDCFLNTYCSKRSGVSSGITEDHFSSPLSELKLISEQGKNSYVALLGERPDLPLEVFLYSLLRFLNETIDSVTASFDFLLSGQNSPGKIFRLSERGLGNHLESCVKSFPKILKLEDSQGLRQVRVLKEFKPGHKFLEILDGYYGEFE